MRKPLRKRFTPLESLVSLQRSFLTGFISLGFCLAMAGLLFMLFTPLESRIGDSADASGVFFLTGFSGCRDKAKSVSWDTDLDFEPAYLKLHRTGELKKRGEELWNIMKSCKLCPRQCGANRLAPLEISHLGSTAVASGNGFLTGLAGEKGFCQATSKRLLKKS